MMSPGNERQNRKRSKEDTSSYMIHPVNHGKGELMDYTSTLSDVGRKRKNDTREKSDETGRVK